MIRPSSLASLVLLCALAVSSRASAQTIRVVTKPVEPFAFQRDGRNVGFSLELWDRIARDMGVRYEVRWVRTVGDVIEALKAHEADVGVAAISITSEREASIDFSTPFYESGLSILVNEEGGGATGAILASVFSADFAKIMGVLFVLLLVTAHLVWWFERGKNPDQFPRSYAQGVWESAWWATSTILSGGCDAKGPVVVGGRIVGAFWMLVCIVVITYFTASITTIMTVNQLTSDIEGPADLPGKSVATVRGTTAEGYLRRHGARVHPFATIDDAYGALDGRHVKAVVYDAPMLLYHTSRNASASQAVVGRLFEKQNYGLALQADSPLRKRLNRILLELREEGFLDELDAKWFGSQG